jgi:beta-lactamase regulating signal transducer with metallopeptidase domain
MTYQVSPEIVRMLGWTLLHFVWQGAAVAALLSLAFAFTRRAAVRYALSVAALLLMLALPFATLLVLQQPAVHISEVPEATDRPVHSATLGPITRHASAATKAEPEQQPETMLWLVRLWMAGVVLFSLRSAGGFVLVQRLRKIANIPASGELLRLCMAVKEQMGIERAVRFCRSAVLQVPAVVGGIRPIVLLPISALTGLSDSQIAAIVAHELAHIQRLDYFVNLFQVFAETVLFYHPAVWWVNKRIRVERENCCDDTAIAVCGNRVDYVRALTHLEKLRITPQFTMAANGSPLKARVRRLLGMSEEREGVRSGASVLGVMGIAGIVLAASSLVNGAKMQETKPVTPATPVVAGQATAAPETPSTPDAPALPAVEPVPPAPDAKPSAAHIAVPAVPSVPVTTPEVHVSVPAMVVNRPAMHVSVPAMNIGVPAVHVAVPPVKVDIPAMHFAVPRVNYSFNMRPALAYSHAMAAQAGAGSGSTQVGESYIDGMKAAGISDLDVDDLVALKVQGVTPEYVREMRASGMKVDADDLVAMKVQGVTPEYVKQMRAAYPGIDTDTIVGFKVQGVTPEYAAEFAKLGVKADAEDIMGLKVQGVTAEYVRDMRATGINFDTEELLGLKVQGVTPAYVNSLKGAGLGKLDADEIVGAKVMGITPEFIEKARSHGFKDLDLDKLVELKNAGVL